MGTPSDYLPRSVSDDSIQELLELVGLPRATEIRSAAVTAQYHAVYFITVPASSHTTNRELVLRISGNHLPTIKTENEIAVVTWVARNTTIPIPQVIAYDSTANNPIAHEYTLLSRVAGHTLSDVYPSLGQDQIAHILDQLIDFLSQLQAHEFHAVGGLHLNKNDNQIEVSRTVDETFWQVPDIEQIWPQETVHSLNVGGPYATYVDLISAQVRTYIRLIRIHGNLAFMRDAVPQLERFVQSLQTHAEELNKVKLRLAHKDLHFANMLYDPASGAITAVLDWEFAGVVPFTKWNPRRAFLWNARDDADSADEKQRLLGLFQSRCAEKGVGILEDAAYASPLQESMQTVADFLRAITEVAPRGQGEDLVQGWKAAVLANAAKFEP